MPTPARPPLPKYRLELMVGLRRQKRGHHQRGVLIQKINCSIVAGFRAHEDTFIGNSGQIAQNLRELLWTELARSTSAVTVGCKSNSHASLLSHRLLKRRPLHDVATSFFEPSHLQIQSNGHWSQRLDGMAGQWKRDWLRRHWPQPEKTGGAQLLPQDRHSSKSPPTKYQPMCTRLTPGMTFLSPPTESNLRLQRPPQNRLQGPLVLGIDQVPASRHPDGALSAPVREANGAQKRVQRESLQTREAPTPRQEKACVQVSQSGLSQWVTQLDKI